MKIDCRTCPVRPQACGGCMMNVFFEVSPTLTTDVDDLFARPEIVDDVAEIIFAAEMFVSAGLFAGSMDGLKIVDVAPGNEDISTKAPRLLHAV